MDYGLGMLNPRWMVPALLLAGCGPSAHFDMRPISSNPGAPDCPVEFVSGAQDQVVARGAPLAVLHVDHADLSWTPRMQAELRPKVCEVGGRVASFAYATENAFNGVNGVELFVFGADAPASPTP